MKSCCALAILKERKECEQTARDWARSYIKLARTAEYDRIADSNEKKATGALIVADTIKFREVPKIDEDVSLESFNAVINEIDDILKSLASD